MIQILIPEYGYFDAQDDTQYLIPEFGYIDDTVLLDEGVGSNIFDSNIFGGLICG